MVSSGFNESAHVTGAMHGVKIPLYRSFKDSWKTGHHVYTVEIHYLPSMKNVHLSGMLILVVVVLILAGCTQPAPTPPVTPTPSPTPVTTAGMGTPGPVSTLPPENNLEFQITPNGNAGNLTHVRGYYGGWV